MEHIKDVWRDARPDEALIDTLRRRSAAGDERAERFVDLLPYLPLRNAILDLAVAADPYWERTGDGIYEAKPGATHETPEELRFAYMKAQGWRFMEDLPPDLRV